MSHLTHARSRTHFLTVIARLGQHLGMTSRYNDKTMKWSVQPPVAPPLPRVRANNQVSPQQTHLSPSSGSSQSGFHRSLWAQTTPDTLPRSPGEWDSMPLMRQYEDIPENIERLVLRISKLPRSITTQMPQRNLFKASKFFPHFNPQGLLLRTSPLFQWYGDDRLFPMQTWEFLVTPMSRRM